MKIIVPSTTPECPLCKKQMRLIYYGIHKLYICTRDTCMISVNANDPCIAKWPELNDPANAPKCQLCKNPMRVFARKDKLVIMQCHDKSHVLYQVARGDARALPPLSKEG